MRFIDLSREDKIAHVARHCNFSPFDPEGWPMNFINDVLDTADRAARDAMEAMINRAMTK